MHVTFHAHLDIFDFVTLIILIYIFLVRSKTSMQVRSLVQHFVTCLFFVVSGCWALAEFTRWQIALFPVRECFFAKYASILLVSNVGFMVDKMSRAKICLRVLRIIPVSIIPPMVSTHTSFIPRNTYNLNK
jgi:hypothetical protein